jgi:hypothetical protein
MLNKATSPMLFNKKITVCTNRIFGTAVFLLCVAKSLNAQVVLKLTKPIDKSQWLALEKKYFHLAYGTVTLVNSNDSWEQLSAEKPQANNLKTNWKQLVKLNGTSNSPSKSDKSSLTEKHIDPGCGGCSILIFPTQVPSDTVEKAKEVLAGYMEIQTIESNTN